MPLPLSEHLLIWIKSYEVIWVHQQIDVETEDQNMVIQIADGDCTVVSSEKTIRLHQRAVLFLGRDTACQLLADPGKPFQISKLLLHKVAEIPCMDLNVLCMYIPLVDTFLARKSRLCVLVDREGIYFTLGELMREWASSYQEKEHMILHLLEILFLKMARSYQLHGKSSGIQYISEAKLFIAEHCEEPLTIQMIADHVGISRSYLQILFSKYARRSIVDHIQAVRVDKAAYLLSTTRMGIVDVAVAAGFNNRQHFARVFTKHFGKCPGEYRKTASQPQYLQSSAGRVDPAKMK